MSVTTPAATKPQLHHDLVGKNLRSVKQLEDLDAPRILSHEIGKSSVGQEKSLAGRHDRARFSDERLSSLGLALNDAVEVIGASTLERFGIVGVVSGFTPRTAVTIAKVASFASKFSTTGPCFPPPCVEHIRN